MDGRINGNDIDNDDADEDRCRGLRVRSLLFVSRGRCGVIGAMEMKAAVL